ncbi:MAG: hypothetical protein VKJ64_16025, partial [Leptolyngbyaceae bacterium]|nr:hypothetical protein [Leptolyngbyaceae bacterium]
MTSQTPPEIQQPSQNGVSPSSGLNDQAANQEASNGQTFSQLTSWQELQNRMAEGPSYVTEESWLLRIMVQLLVSVGIIATD